jgi:hypothetical protein
MPIVTVPTKMAMRAGSATVVEKPSIKELARLNATIENPIFWKGMM